MLDPLTLLALPDRQPGSRRRSKYTFKLRSLLAWANQRSGLVNLPAGRAVLIPPSSAAADFDAHDAVTVCRSADPQTVTANSPAAPPK
jgi:hypothetical protein